MPSPSCRHAENSTWLSGRTDGKRQRRRSEAGLCCNRCETGTCAPLAEGAGKCAPFPVTSHTETLLGKTKQELRTRSNNSVKSYLSVAYGCVTQHLFTVSSSRIGSHWDFKNCTIPNHSLFHIKKPMHKRTIRCSASSSDW